MTLLYRSAFHTDDGIVSVIEALHAHQKVADTGVFQRDAVAQILKHDRVGDQSRHQADRSAMLHQLVNVAKQSRLAALNVDGIVVVNVD